VRLTAADAESSPVAYFAYGKQVKHFQEAAAPGPNLLSTAERPKDSQAGEQDRRGAVTGRRVGAQKRSTNQKREIPRRADRARWS
jgi:hypothetical protein